MTGVCYAGSTVMLAGYFNALKLGSAATTINAKSGGGTNDRDDAFMAGKLAPCTNRLPARGTFECALDLAGMATGTNFPVTKSPTKAPR